MDRLTYPDIARIFGTGLIATGVGLLLFVFVTVTWGDPFTSFTASAEQEKLSAVLDAELPPSKALRNAALDPELTKAAARLAQRRTPLGSAAGRILIPKIDLREGFVHGARNGTPDLTKGPGLYKETLWPGSGTPVAIAGHRTTYGAPFLRIDELKPGDTITLQLSYGTFTYRVTRQQIITPDDWSIINFGAAKPTPAGRAAVLRTTDCIDTCEHLVLTACHPKYSAAKRIAVFAQLAKVQLPNRGAAAA